MNPLLDNPPLDSNGVPYDLDQRVQGMKSVIVDSVRRDMTPPGNEFDKQFARITHQMLKEVVDFAQSKDKNFISRMRARNKFVKNIKALGEDMDNLSTQTQQALDFASQSTELNQAHEYLTQLRNNSPTNGAVENAWLDVQSFSQTFMKERERMLSSVRTAEHSMVRLQDAMLFANILDTRRLDAAAISQAVFGGASTQPTSPTLPPSQQDVIDRWNDFNQSCRMVRETGVSTFPESTASAPEVGAAHIKQFKVAQAPTDAPTQSPTHSM